MSANGPHASARARLYAAGTAYMATMAAAVLVFLAALALGHDGKAVALTVLAGMPIGIAAAIVAAVRVRVAVTDDGVEYVNLLTRQRVPWGHIAELRTRPVGSSSVVQVLQRTDGRRRAVFATLGRDGVLEFPAARDDAAASRPGTGAQSLDAAPALIAAMHAGPDEFRTYLRRQHRRAVAMGVVAIIVFIVAVSVVDRLLRGG